MSVQKKNSRGEKAFAVFLCKCQYCRHFIRSVFRFSDTDSFKLFGMLQKPGTRLVVAVSNGQKYEVLYSLDNGGGISINESGLFHTGRIKLNVGLNRIKLVAYLDEALTSPEPGKNIQITYVTVKYSPDGKEQVLNSDRSITDVFQDIKKSLSGE